MVGAFHGFSALLVPIGNGGQAEAEGYSRSVPYHCPVVIYLELQVGIHGMHSYIEDSGQVLYRSDMTHGKNKKNFELLPAGQFIASEGGRSCRTCLTG